MSSTTLPARLATIAKRSLLATGLAVAGLVPLQAAEILWQFDTGG